MAFSLKQHYQIPALLGGVEPVGEIPPERSLYGKFIRMAWPSVVESVLVALVGIADTIMVSSLGDLAIDAVGICTQPKFILLCFIFALDTGLTAVVARRKGAGDREAANRSLRNALIVGLTVILVLCALGARFAEPFLKLAGADDSYLADGVMYFRIICLSVVFQALNNLINAAQKGSGYTRISMTTNLLGNLVNIVFNYLLINGIGPFPRWGIKGAAVATVIGTFTALMFSLSRLFVRKNYLNVFIRVPWRLSADILNPIMKVSGSALAEQLVMRVGFFLFNLVVAKLSPTAYATHIICMNMMSLSFCFGDGFQVAATALAGQSLGAKRPDLAFVFCNIGRRIVTLVAIFLSIVFISFRHPIMRLYTDTPEIIEMGGYCLMILALITYAQTAQVICTGCLRGAGDTRFTARMSLICIGVVRPLAGYVLAYVAGWGLYGAWLGSLLDQACRLALSARRINQGKWVQIKL